MAKSKAEKKAHTQAMQDRSYANKNKTIQGWADGGVTGNKPDAEISYGGCGVVLLYKEHRKELVFPIPEKTTNNRAELYGLIYLFQSIHDKGKDVDVYCDSGYVINCFKDKWYVGWEKDDKWINSKKEPVANRDLWELLLDEYRKFYGIVTFYKVNGHVGVELNDLCDRLAQKGKTRAKEMLGH